MPQETKLNPWEFHSTKKTLLATFVPNTGHLDHGAELIYTLQWVLLDESVFVLTQKSPSSCHNHITKLKILYHQTFHTI